MIKICGLQSLILCFGFNHNYSMLSHRFVKQECVRD